jgi:hypothetical protein
VLDNELQVREDQIKPIVLTELCQMSAILRRVVTREEQGRRRTASERHQLLQSRVAPKSPRSDIEIELSH